MKPRNIKPLLTKPHSRKPQIGNKIDSGHHNPKTHSTNRKLNRFRPSQTHNWNWTHSHKPNLPTPLSLKLKNLEIYDLPEYLEANRSDSSEWKISSSVCFKGERSNREGGWGGKRPFRNSLGMARGWSKGANWRGPAESARNRKIGVWVATLTSPEEKRGCWRCS